LNNSSFIEEKVFEIAKPHADKLGLDIVDIEYKTHSKDKVLTIFIDRKGGVTLDDCSNLSLAVEPLLDEEDIIATGYLLEVSSPGIDRPLDKDSDLERNMDSLVDIRLNEHQEKRLEFQGILKSFTDEHLTIMLDEPFVKGVKPKTNGQERTFLRKNIRTIKKAIRF